MAMHPSAFLTNGGLGVSPVWRLDDDPYCLLGLLPSQRLQRTVDLGARSLGIDDRDCAIAHGHGHADEKTAHQGAPAPCASHELSPSSSSRLSMSPMPR